MKSETVGGEAGGGGRLVEDLGGLGWESVEGGCLRVSGDDPVDWTV